MEVDIDPALDHAKLKAEQDEIMREQASGAWDRKGVDPEWVRTRIKRGIEVTALLRRTNTGPAKPKSSRRGGKGKVDVEAITEELLK
jgi:hypothetical protein